jgi:prefoldin subunit 5
MRRIITTIAAGALLMGGGAQAQDLEAAAEAEAAAAEAELLGGEEGGAPLMEEEKPKEVAAEDPDPKLLAAVEKGRDDLEAMMNILAGVQYQNIIQTEKKLNKAYDRLASGALKLTEEWIQQHNKAMAAFEEHGKKPGTKAAKKAEKQLVKTRKQFQKKLTKLTKGATKLRDKVNTIIEKEAAAAE